MDWLRVARWLSIITVIAWSAIVLKTVMPQTLAAAPYRMPSQPYVAVSARAGNINRWALETLRFARRVVVFMVVDQ